VTIGWLTFITTSRYFIFIILFSTGLSIILILLVSFCIVCRRHNQLKNKYHLLTEKSLDEDMEIIAESFDENDENDEN
jgi:hypothetical protein